MKKSKFWLVSLLMMVVTLCCVFAVACDVTTTPTDKEEGSEKGVYYYTTSEGQEYTVTLDGISSVTFDIGTFYLTTTYELDEDGIFTFALSEAVDYTISATYSDDVITLNYDEAEMRFLRKTYFTVTFNTNISGVSVGSVTVLNGQSLTKPEDPEYEGYVFLGWYVDTDLTATFAFGSDIITGDTTLYGRWAATVAGMDEYEVSFDLNYDGAETLDTVETIGGLLYNVTTPERSGYTFCGWWISMYDSEEKLSFLYEDSYLFTENTTLYALWAENTTSSKLATPVVNVTSTTISWDAVSGSVNNYTISIYKNDTYIDGASTPNTTYVCSYLASTGEYRIEVTAISSAGESYNSETAVRYYASNMLSRVSLFTVVEPAVLLFNSVANAQKYYITIECGDEYHEHTLFDNGTSVYYDFSNCLMQEGGITFTVKAVADGYVSSTSRTFVYSRDLDEVTGYDYDEDTATLVWNSVENATSYIVTVYIDGKEVYCENIGAVNSFNIKEFSGNITVEVYAKTKGYNSVAATSYSVSKASLATPSDIKITGTVVSWSAVEGATGYELTIDGVTVTATEETSYDVAEMLSWVKDTDYTLTIRATGASANSLWSDGIDVRYLSLYSSLTYDTNTVTWRPVVGAEYYVVTVNDGESEIVEDGSYSLKVTLTQAGTNTIYVQFYDSTSGLSTEATLTVYAHTISYNSNGGSAVESQYYAVGDEITFPEEPTKTGYNFAYWYTTPGGPSSNGLRYTDEFFNQSSELTLYAFYTSKEYTIHFDAQEGSTGTVTSMTVYYGQMYTLTVPTILLVTEESKTFMGWYSAVDGKGTQYTDYKGESLNVWSLSEEDDLYTVDPDTGECYFTVYAYWQENVLSYTLTKVNGVTGYAVAKGSKISSVTEVTIPETYKGLPVLMIVTGGFQSCTTLVTVNIPDTIETIGSDVFKSCSKLQEVNVYSTGTNILRYESSDGVLFDRGELQNVTVTGENYTLTLLYFPVAKTGSYTIPDKVVDIPASAFNACKLSEIIIPASVQTIGATAFSGSTSLSSVIFEAAEEGVEASLTIGDRAFYNCDALTSVTLPKHLVSMSTTTYYLGSATGNPTAQTVSYGVTSSNVTFAFAGCDNLTSLYVVSGNAYYTSTYDGAMLLDAGGTSGYTIILALKAAATGALDLSKIYLQYTSETEYTTANILAVGDGAFVSCTNLTSLVVPGTVASIGEAAFYYCTKITSITFKGPDYEGLTIGRYAFRSCSGMTSLVFEEAGNTDADGNEITSSSNVKEIGEGAFYSCSKITSLTIPASVQYIGVQAFRGCTTLATVTITGSANTGYTLAFGENAFYGCTKLTTINLPANVSEIPGIFSGCTSLETINIDPDNPYIVAYDKVIYTYAKDNSGNFIYYDDNGNASDAENGYKVVDTISYISLSVTDYEIPTGKKQITVESTDADTGETVTTEYYVYIYITTLGNSLFKGNTSLTSINIPDTVTYIGEQAFYQCTKLTTVYIPASVTYIDNAAFYSCTLLSSVTFEDAETENPYLEIGQYAFYSCVSLITLTLPSQTKTIGQYFAYNCTGLVTINLNEGLEEIPTYAFYGCNGLVGTIVIPSTVKSIGYYAIANSATSTISSKVTSITFAKNENGETALTTIGTYAFNRLSLTSISIPASVQEIGYYAFRGRYYEYYSGTSTYPTTVYSACLESVTFETYEDGTSSLTTIMPYAFYHQDKLTSVTLPNSVTSIGAYAFYYCTSLQTLVFEDGGTQGLSIGAALTYNSTATATATESTGKYVFGYCSALTSVTFPSNIAKIGDYAFYYCKALETVDFASTTDEEGNVIYESNSGSYAYIGEYAFNNCTSLTSITIPWYITNSDGSNENARYAIGARAFYYCVSLSSLEFVQAGCGSEESDLPLTFGDYAFSYCRSLTELNLPARMANYTEDGIEYAPFAGNHVFTNTTSLAAINIEDGGDVYCSEDGIVYNVDKTELVLCPEGKSGTVEVPVTVTSINNYAFYRCMNLTEITFEDSDTELAADESNALEIGSYAFGYCTGLTSLELPTRLTTINTYAFTYCSNLAYVLLPKNYKSYDTTTFNQCVSLNDLEVESGSTYFKAEDSVLYTADMTRILVYLSSKTEETYVVPSTVKTIDEKTFYNNTYLKNIYLSNVITIGASAFAYSNIEYVYIPKTVVDIAVLAFYNCANLKTVEFEEGGTQDLVVGETTLTSAASTSVFGGTTSLESITFPSRTTYIGPYCFYYSGVKSISIPSTVETLGVSAFRFARELQTFTFEDAENSKLTSLENYTFASCYALTSITLPDSIETVGTYLFYCDANLKEVVLPANLTALNTYMFSYCASLETLEIPANVNLAPSTAFTSSTAPFLYCRSLNLTFAEDYAGTAFGNYLFYRALKSIEIPASVKTIGNYVFAYSYLTEIEIPDTVTSIGTYLFQNSSMLADVTLPSNSTYTTLSNYMFNNCKALETIDIPDKITSLGSYAFKASGLTTFTAPDTVTNIGTYTFQDCESLTSVTLPTNSSFKTLGNYVFDGCILLASLEIPSTVTSIGTYTFRDCTSLTSLTIPSKVTSIGASSATGTGYTFSGSGLTSITIPDTVTKFYGTYMFKGCESLTSVTLPSSITAIQAGTFDGCTSLASFEIPSKVTSIGAYTFRDCTSLTSLEIPSKVTTIGASTATGSGYTFAGSGLTSITIPDTVTKFYGTYMFSECENLTSVTLPSSLTAIQIGTFNGCTSLAGLEIPSTVTSIGNYAFRNCKSLTSLEIPTAVTTIGGTSATTVSYTFAGSGLTSIVIPDTVTKFMGTYMFSGCENLTSVTLPSNSGFTSIGTYWFSDCTNLSEINIPDNVISMNTYAFQNCTSLTTIDLNNLTSLSAYAFQGSGLTEITIPETVGFISDYTFAYCTDLKTVTLNEGLQYIYEGAFWGCTSLEAITLPASIVSSAQVGITGNPFVGCTSLTEFAVAEGSYYTVVDGVLYDDEGVLIAYPAGAVETTYTIAADLTIGDYAFGGTTFETVIVSSGVTFGSYAFGSATIGTLDLSNTEYDELSSYLLAGVTSIDKVILPSTLNTIGTYAFAYSTIAEIEIPKSVTLIDDYAFYYTESLTSLTFEAGGDGILTIDSYAFAYSGIKSIEFPARLRGYDTGDGSYVYAIGQYAFTYSSIETVTFEDGSAYTSDNCFNVYSYAFRYSNLKSISLPSYFGDLSYVNSSGTQTSVAALYLYAFADCTQLESVTFSADTPTVQTDENGDVVYDDDGNAVPYTFTFSTDIFQNCTSLTTFEWPVQLVALTAGLFDGAGLTEITIPSTVTTMNSVSYVFRNNVNLVTATIEGQGEYIGGFMFSGCTSLKTVNINTDTIKYIGASAFSGCTALESINIPDSVTDILYAAFADCTSLLNITIPSSVRMLGTSSVTVTTTVPTGTLGANWDSYKVFAGWTAEQTITIESKASTAAWMPSWSETEATIVYLG